jgi:hypothetical protein
MIIDMIEVLIAHRGKEIEGEYIADGTGGEYIVDEARSEGEGECVQISHLLQERCVDVFRD